MADDLADELGALLRLKESTADAVTQSSKHFPRGRNPVYRELNRAVGEVLPEVLSTIDTGNLIRQYSVRHSIGAAPRNGKAITLTYQSAQPPNTDDVRGAFWKMLKKSRNPGRPILLQPMSLPSWRDRAMIHDGPSDRAGCLCTASERPKSRISPWQIEQHAIHCCTKWMKVYETYTQSGRIQPSA